MHFIIFELQLINFKWNLSGQSLQGENLSIVTKHWAGEFVGSVCDDEDNIAWHCELTQTPGTT